MTEYGVLIKNTSGNVQIDGTYKNYTYYEHNSSSLSIENNVIDITNTTSSLICVIKPNIDAVVYPYGFVDTTTPGTYESINLAADGTCVCEWLLYKDGQSTSSGGYGLLVKDINNEVAFNSNEIGYTTLLNRYEYDVGTTLGDYDDITVDNTDNYFQLTGGNWYQQTTGGTQTNYLLGIKKIDSTTVRVEYVPVESFAAGGTSFGVGAFGPTFLFEFKAPPSI